MVYDRTDGGDKFLYAKFGLGGLVFMLQSLKH